MTFSTAVDRARSEFDDMPGLELTLPQAVRLWGLGADDCRNVIDALVDVGFLRWTAGRTVIRADNGSRRAYGGLDPAPAFVLARARPATRRT